MLIFLIVLIILTCTLLVLVVLAQNPKGGGLSGNVFGVSSQFMGVKQTNDVLEKGTWVFTGIIAILCLTSTVFISKTGTSGEDKTEKIGTAPIQASPNQSNTTTLPAAPAKIDTSK